MIKKLKTKFVLTIMVFVTIIIAAFVIFTTVIPYQKRNEDAKLFLNMIAENGGVRVTPEISLGKPIRHNDDTPPQSSSERSMFNNANIATAHFNSTGVLLRWFSDRQDLFDQEYIISTAAEVVAKNKEFGIINGQYFLLKNQDSGYLVILMDNSVAFANSRSSFLIACVAGIVIWLMFFALTMWLVEKMVTPVRDAFARQRQFISDAGHELKTPISVIGANANVLQSEIGENKWLGYINDETHRMENLVKSLMTLAAVDDKDDKTGHYTFDLSKAAMSICLPFESLAFEKGIIMDFDVAENIYFTGNEEKIKQVVSILLNNAVKYGEENGRIEVRLYRERKKIVLSVYNTGQGIKPDELNMIFERFYRSDKARSRDGQSYGLGLAIAKAVVEEHNGTIRAASDFGRWVNFTAEFPVK